jgi:glutathione S-transferase
VAITLYHHPFSRAAGVLWPLEEVGVPYQLEYVDFAKGQQKAPALVALNPMGKIPVLVDRNSAPPSGGAARSGEAGPSQGDTVITEGAAIALYLADRYAPGKLAPAIDDPRRGTYLRWALFAPSVIEPAAMAKRNNWEFKPSQAGWGDWDAMLATIDHALSKGDYVLGDTFSMADVVFGGNLSYMRRFNLVPMSALAIAYTDRLAARPASKRADARNAAIIKERGLG